MNNVHIKDEIELKNKLLKIKSDGIKSLHVVSDHDATLTTLFVDGKHMPSAFHFLRQGNYMPDDYKKLSQELYTYYNSFFLNNTMSSEEKSKLMLEWPQKVFQAMQKHGLSKEILQKVIDDEKYNLRTNSAELFKLLNEYNVPLIVFSGGLGDIITGFIKKENLLFENVHIVSNFFKFDNDGFVVGLKNKIVTTMNKDEGHINDESILKLIETRKNAILLGDSLGDVKMVNPDNNHVILKIGFLNENIDDNMEIYMDNFDVVITNDGPMDYVLNILNDIISS